MQYIEELTNQLLKLKNRGQTKIDVHFIISEPLTSFCFNVNQEIRKHNIGFINMGIESIVLPHISIFMGFVDSYEMLESVFNIVDIYSKKLCPFQLDPTNMYFKGVSSTAPQYLFIDSLQNDFFVEQKETLDNLLGEAVYPIGWDMKGERAHITVGCYKNITKKVCEVVDSYRIIPSCRISQIGVSISGQRGVCLGLLKVYDLYNNISL